MRGVGAVTFGGAELAGSGAGDRLRFTINISLATGATNGGRLAQPGR